MTFAEDLLKGKRALVTGGTQGIGAAVSQQLAAMGAEVIAAGLPSANALPRSSAAGNGSVRLAEVDVSNQDSVNALFRTMDRLDILVNCAGIIGRVPNMKWKSLRDHGNEWVRAPRLSLQGAERAMVGQLVASTDDGLAAPALPLQQ
jgi:NAD(P)-dependent dehydrogenase (short-subunit alcohol dehydrogenase family)